MTNRPDDEPVLVRPYVGTGSDETPEQPAEQPAAEESATWPAEAGLPGDEQPTAVQPAISVPPPPEPRGHPVHWGLRLLVLIIGVAVALGIAAYFILGGGSRDDARGPGASLPTVNPAVPTGVAPSSARPSASASRSSSSPSPSASASSPVPPSAKQSPTPAPAGRKPTLAPPPAGDRTGRISSAGGRCLTLGGLLGLDGSPIQAASCSGGTAQKFTLATDGTLRLADRCVTASGDGSARSGGCTGAGDSAQWRSGPGGSLVNPASGRCLTDPGTSGATSTVAACTGHDDQRWSLP
jgi:hypothetical protein